MPIFNTLFRLYQSLILLLVVSMSAFTIKAQEITPQNLERLQIMEDSMLITVDSMFNAFIPDTHIGYSEKLVRQLVKTLKTPNSYYYTFPKLSQKLNVLIAPDSAFRMFNWEVDYSNIYKRYYGAVQLPSENLKLFGLLDYSEKLGKLAEDTVLTQGKWYGALYYRILVNEVEGKPMYTLFGLNSGSPVSDKKVLDPMFIADNGITFGHPVFGVASRNFPRERVKRFIIEYKKDVSVSLKWDAEKKAIVFDNLVSAVNDPARRYTYIPSGQYDGLRWNNEMWNFVMSIVPIQILQDGEAPTDEK